MIGIEHEKHLEIFVIVLKSLNYIYCLYFYCNFKLIYMVYNKSFKSAAISFNPMPAFAPYLLNYKMSY